MSHKQLKFKLISIAMLLVLGSTSVQAQSVQVPTNLNPGAVDSYNKKNNNLYDRLKKNDDESDSIIDKTNFSDKEYETEKSYRKFTIHTVEFDGNTVIKDKELNELAEGFLDKEITIKELKALSRQVTGLYKNRGYMTSFAYIQPQNISDGVLTIKVLEGKVGTINIMGNKWTKDSYLNNKVFKANKVNEEKVFNVDNLKNSMRTVNEISYLKGRATLTPGEVPETTDIELNLEEKLPIRAGVSYDNTGPTVVGEDRVNFLVGIDNVTGFGDTLYAVNTLASGTTGVGAGYKLPLGSKGTEIGFDYSYSNVELGRQFKRNNIEGSSTNYRIYLNQKLYKSANLDISTDLAWDMRASEATIFNRSIIDKYNSRVLRSGINLIKDDSYGRLIARIENSIGLPVWGASTQNIQFGSGHGVPTSKFYKLSGQVIRANALPLGMLGVFRLGGQFTSDTLLPSEKLLYGGMNTVRGFHESELIGDLGYNASIEVRTPIFFLPEAIYIPKFFSKNTDESYELKLKERINFVTFYDQAFAQDIHQGSNETFRNFYQSLGCGFRVNLSKVLTGKIDVGFPIGRSRYNNQNAARFHFGIASNLL